MPSIVNTLPASTINEYPPSYAQFGNKCFIVRGDQRPQYLLASLADSTIKAYDCGIRAPTFYPSCTAASADAENISFDTNFYQANILYICYAYYSSVRGVFSQISPVTEYNLNTLYPSGTGIKKVEISGFFNPRDNAVSQDIDTIVVGVQYGISSDYMCLLPDLSKSVTPGTDFSSYTITFDLSQAQLENGGFGLGTLSDFSYIPPASKYIQRYGERLFYAGARSSLTLDDCGIAATKATLTGTVALDPTGSGDALAGSGTLFLTELSVNDIIKIQVGSALNVFTIESIASNTAAVLTSPYTGTATSGLTCKRYYRDIVAARLTLTAGTEGTFQGFNDSHYHMGVFANGQFLGNILDVEFPNPYVAYLDRDVPSNISDTVDFYLVGYNDRLIPSGYTNETSGDIPTAFPEAVQLTDYQLLTQAVDEGQKLEGLSADGEFLYALFNETVVQMLGGNEINIPIQPVFRPMQGRVGTVAPRSICKDNVGRLAWIGEEGLCVGDSGGVDSVAHAAGCNLFFGKSDRWMDKTTLTECKQTFSRYYDGYVFGGFNVNTTDLTGTLACTYGSGTVTGTGTLFQDELNVGDIIFIYESYYRVLTLTSHTAMTITPFVSSTGSYLAEVGAGYYALFSIKPQIGLWLMNGQVITSNIIEYQDSNGQGQILCGDHTGVIKRLFSPDTFTDCAPWTDTTYVYKSSWREGFQSSQTGQISTLDSVWLNGVVMYDSEFTTVFIDLNHWHTNFPVRDESLIPWDQKVTDTVLESVFGFTIPLTAPVTATRYHSMEFEIDGQDVEISRITEMLGTT